MRVGFMGYASSTGVVCGLTADETSPLSSALERLGGAGAEKSMSKNRMK